MKKPADDDIVQVNMSTMKKPAKKKPSKKKKHNRMQVQFPFRGNFYRQSGATAYNFALWLTVTDSAIPPNTLYSADTSVGSYNVKPQIPAGTDKRVTLTFYQAGGGGQPVATLPGIDGNPAQAQVNDIILNGTP